MDNRQTNTEEWIKTHSAVPIRKIFGAGPDNCTERTSGEGRTRPRGRLCRWNKVKGAGKRKINGDAEPDIEQRLLRLSRLSAEQFVSQLCMKPTFSTTLEDGEGEQKPLRRGLTDLFHITQPLSLPHCLCIHLFIYLFIHVPLSDTLAVSLYTSLSLLLTQPQRHWKTHTIHSITSTHGPFLTRSRSQT